jgi:DNA invertase Pin-like site-specific DNA recombinase
LGRNYSEIQQQWRILTKEIGIDICVLDMPLLDTRRDKDLTGIFISDIVLQILSYVAETERNMIRQRQAEGISAAKSRGKTWGRPKRQLDQAFFDALAAWKKGEKTCSQAAQSCGMTLSNFRYHAGKQA